MSDRTTAIVLAVVAVVGLAFVYVDALPSLGEIQSILTYLTTGLRGT